MKTSIPKDIREQLAHDPFMEKCCICGVRDGVQWHHNLIFGGKAIQEWWAILPVCFTHHLLADTREIRSQLNRIMRERSEDKLLKYEGVKRFT